MWCSNHLIQYKLPWILHRSTNKRRRFYVMKVSIGLNSHLPIDLALVIWLGSFFLSVVYRLGSHLLWVESHYNGMHPSSLHLTPRSSHPGITAPVQPHLFCLQLAPPSSLLCYTVIFKTNFWYCFLYLTETVTVSNLLLYRKQFNIYIYKRIL